MTRAAPCSPGCPGWAVFEVNEAHGVELQACDECDRFTDDEVQAMPRARRALADHLLAHVRGSRVVRSPLRGRALTRARDGALREHDLRAGLSLVIQWCEARRDDPERHSAEYALMQIEGVANAALGVEEASG